MLQIRKEGNKNFTHIDTVSGNKYIASDVTISANNNQILITKEKGSAVFFKIGFDISEVQVYDDTGAGTLETFSTPTALFNRLIALGYPAFYEDGQITLSLNEILDVNITALEDGQFLAYNQSTGFWENVDTNPASSVAWDELTGSPSDSTDLVNLIVSYSGNPSYEAVDFGNSLWATTSGAATTEAEINALINAQGFEIELGVLYKFYIGLILYVNGKSTLYVAYYVFENNNVLGTYGTGSTNGEVSIGDFLNTNSYEYISLPPNNERVDLGEIGATAIYTYINNLDTTGLSWETLTDDKVWYFYATVSGVAKVYQYTGIFPRDVGSAYSGADPLLDTDFDLQDTENSASSVDILPLNNTFTGFNTFENNIELQDGTYIFHGVTDWQDDEGDGFSSTGFRYKDGNRESFVGIETEVEGLPQLTFYDPDNGDHALISMKIWNSSFDGNSNSIDIGGSGAVLSCNNPLSKGLLGGAYYGANYNENTYVQKKYVDDNITINSDVTSEPSGSDQVLNVVSLTQAEYDAGSPIATTFYIITDA